MISLIATQILETPETTKPREPVVLRCVKACWITSPFDGYDKHVIHPGQDVILHCHDAKLVVLRWIALDLVPRCLVVVSGYP